MVEGQELQYLPRKALKMQRSVEVQCEIRILSSRKS